MSLPIVLIHGMWCTDATLAQLKQLLSARGYAVHLPNLPAHQVGVENAEVGNKSLKDYLDFLEDYVRRQNFARPPVIIGHSMGGLLAQQLAVRTAPFALVLLTPAPPAGIMALSGSNPVAV